MNVRVLGSVASLVVVLSAAACSSSSSRSGFEQSKDGTESDGGSGGAGFGGGDAGVGSNCAVNNVEKDGDKDFDGDGYPLKYDCNECDPNINAGAFDVPGNNIDEDCSGAPDDEAADCDQNLSLDGADPFDGAKAIGLCKKASPKGKEWGVIEAKWVRPDGSPQTQPLGEGILPKFGVNAPQTGAAMLAISSGSARAPGDPGYNNGPLARGWDKSYSHGTPAGYPKESPACAGKGGFGFASGSHDGAALMVKIRVPSNAKSFKFQQNFFTFEFPEYICADYNDFFVTIMDPKPKGLADGNISFDQDNNPISVNNSLLQVCRGQSAGGKTFTCPLGSSTLQGTGFENHAATGWLTTTAPVDTLRGKEMTIMWAIWDQGDGILDSTALIDDFSWSVDAADGTQTLPTPPK
jgi:hypothetical protein